MDYNVIQLRDNTAFTVNDDEFKKVEKKYNSFFSRHTIRFKDSRGRKITLDKKDILLLEERADEKENN